MSTEKNFEHLLSDHWESNQHNITTIPFSIQSSYDNKYQACSSRILQLPDGAKILPQDASKKEQEIMSKNTWFVVDYWMFRILMLNCFSGSGNGRSNFVFQLSDPVGSAFVFSAHECLIIGGVQVPITYSTCSDCYFNCEQKFSGNYNLGWPIFQEFLTKIAKFSWQSYCIEKTLLVGALHPHLTVELRQFADAFRDCTFWEFFRRQAMSNF